MSTTMEIQREDLNPCTIQLTIKCAPEQVQAGFSRAYKAYAKRIRVPGFRPGTAPKKILEPMIDKRDLYNTAADEIVRHVLTEALKAEKIQPHEAPSVDVKELKEDEGECQFVAKVPLKPIVELGEYKGLEIDAPAVEVTDAEVEQQLDELRKRAGKREAVTDRGVHEGDVAVVNIKVAGEEGDGKNFMSVAGQLFPALDKAIAGMEVEEIKMAELTFPKDFQNKDWAGKKKKVQITIRSLNHLAMPDLDDEFAKQAVGDNLKSESLDELKGKLRERLVEAKSAVGEEMIFESIQEKLLATSTVHVPDTMWENVANQRLQEEAQTAAQQGKKLEDVAKENGMELEEYVEKWKAEARVQVRRAVLTNAIFEKEGLKLANADYNDMLMQMAMEINVDPRQLFEHLKRNNALYELEVRARYKKVMGFLREQTKVGKA